MLDNKLIENALALTGKTMDDMLQIDFDYGYEIKNQQIILRYDDSNIELGFSIEKFSYYLLSPEFIEKYDKIIYPESSSPVPYLQSIRYGKAIYLYQLGQKHHLIDLLSIIGKN